MYKLLTKDGMAKREESLRQSMVRYRLLFL